MANTLLIRKVQDLKEKLLAMGGLVEHALEIAVDCLNGADAGRLLRVLEIENRIDGFQKDIDRDGLDVLACHKPSAVDLRVVFAILKMNTDLERMGDKAVSIAHGAHHLSSLASMKPPTHLPRMAAEVKMMIRGALNAFTHRDLDLAQGVLLLDESVDQLGREMIKELTTAMKTNVQTVEPSIDMILIVRSLTRLGDHATNIAEDVVFIATGEDIRHDKLRIADS